MYLACLAVLQAPDVLENEVLEWIPRTGHGLHGVLVVLIFCGTSTLNCKSPTPGHQPIPVKCLYTLSLTGLRFTQAETQPYVGAGADIFANSRASLPNSGESFTSSGSDGPPQMLSSESGSDKDAIQDAGAMSPQTKPPRVKSTPKKAKKAKTKSAASKKKAAKIAAAEAVRATSASDTADAINEAKERQEMGADENSEDDDAGAAQAKPEKPAKPQKQPKEPKVPKEPKEPKSKKPNKDPEQTKAIKKAKTVLALFTSTCEAWLTGKVPKDRFVFYPSPPHYSSFADSLQTVHARTHCNSTITAGCQRRDSLQPMASPLQHTSKHTNIDALCLR